MEPLTWETDSIIHPLSHYQPTLSSVLSSVYLPICPKSIQLPIHLTAINQSHHTGNSLEVQRLGLSTFTAVGLGSVPGQDV